MSPPAPPEVAALTAGLDIDVADVIASQSKESAKTLLRLGRGPTDSLVGVDYLARADSLLGRLSTADEGMALEGCIRHYLRAWSTS